jgi:hypothetical protein
MGIWPLLAAAATAAGAQTLEGVDAARLAREAASARPPAIVQGPLGAWYRKIESAESPAFEGLDASGVLPAPSFDSNRMHVPGPGEPEYMRGPLDSPAVYVGLHAGSTELDAGLKWDHAYDSSGQSVGQFAWRVFWRARDGAGNSWHNAPPGSNGDIYLLPGDAFTMTLTVRPDGQAHFEVLGAGERFAVLIPLTGLGDGAQRAPRSFKRVHSIDQFRDEGGWRRGNENSPAIPTRAKLTGGRWTAVNLLIGARRIPLAGELARDVRPGDEADRYRAIFPAAGLDARGGEPIDIIPPAPPTAP